MTKLDAGLMTSLPASDPGSAAVWGSKRINPWPQSCLCLTWSGYPSNDDDNVVMSSKCTKVDAFYNQSGLIENSMIVPVWIHSKTNSLKEILCYCILDDQLNACFISNKLRQQLGVNSSSTTLTLSAMHKKVSLHVNMFQTWKYLALTVKQVFNFYQSLPEITFLQANFKFPNPNLHNVGNT